MKFPVFEASPITKYVNLPMADEDFYTQYNKNVDIDYLEVQAKDPNLLSILSWNYFDVGNFISRKPPYNNYIQVSCNFFYLYARIKVRVTFMYINNLYFIIL